MLRQLSLWAAISCLWAASTVFADFRLFDYYDPKLLATLWNLSDDCILALNTTVACDLNTATMVGGGIDENYWYKENITTLCTKNCLDSLQSWEPKVERACAGQTVPQSGVTVEAKALALSFTHNAGIACMRDSKSNWCFYDSQNWDGSDYVRWDPEACDDVDSADSPAICKDPDFDIGADLTPDMMDMTNLYNSSFYCSECFMKLFRQRLLDPWLVKSNFTDYLIGQFDTIQSKCSTTMPYKTSSSTLYVPPKTTTTPTATTTMPSGAPSPTCLGQMVQPNKLSCNALSDTYNVSTGDVRSITGSFVCEFTTPICLPLPCPIDIVWGNPSCASLAQKYSNGTYVVTEGQFFSWNSNIQGSCDGVSNGQRVCKQAPGGTFPSVSASISAPTGTSGYTATATAAYPTQSGTIADCGKFYKASAGDDCYTIGVRFGITFAQLRKWNTFLNEQCTNLWLNYDVCVAEVSHPNRSKDGNCGQGIECKGSGFGDCCSTAGKCTNINCGPTPPSNGTVSQNGECGPDHGFTTCPGSLFGDCCSIYGHCGNSMAFCGAGNCYSGKCATDNGGPSTNGECGPNFAGNKTCTGTQFGKCCSTSGYCGSTAEYCGRGKCYSGACLSAA